MKTRKSGGKRLAPRRTQTAADHKNKQFSSTTIEIPVESIFEDVSVKNLTRLEISCPGNAPMVLPIDKDEIYIGRDKECLITLNIANVSRVHARIVRISEDFVLEDLNSTNGTFVNNVRIMRCILHDNDQIRIGEARMFFVRQKERMIR